MCLPLQVTHIHRCIVSRAGHRGLKIGQTGWTKNLPNRLNRTSWSDLAWFFFLCTVHESDQTGVHGLALNS